MSLPDPICSVSCGAGELVPEFYKVLVPIYTFPFADYNDGVIYKYVGTEPTRCVWEREFPGEFDWTIERLSRYALGWHFPEIEPIPGVWSYRLSIDRIGFPLLLHGWSNDFPRFGIGVPDPAANCSSSQELLNYVPLTIRPPARVVPVVDSVVPPKIKQRSSPCFCHDDCPFDTRPFRQYLVFTDDLVNFPEYEFGIFYRFVSSFEDNCGWQADVPPFSGSHQFTKDSVVVAMFDHAYRIKLTLSRTSPTIVKSWETTYPWNESGVPISGLDARCDVTFNLSNPDLSTATLVPLPAWICTTSQARDWFTSLP